MSSPAGEGKKKKDKKKAKDDAPAPQSPAASPVAAAPPAAATPASAEKKQKKEKKEKTAAADAAPAAPAAAEAAPAAAAAAAAAEPAKDKKKKHGKTADGAAPATDGAGAGAAAAPPAAAAATAAAVGSGAPPPDAVQGKCRCGTVTFAAWGTPNMSLYCHCAQCRSAHGAPFAHIVVFPEDRVVVLSGQDSLITPAVPGAGASGGRFACAKCGQRVLNHVASAKIKGVFPANFSLPGGPDHPQLPSGWPAQYHAFYDNRVVDVADALPHYADLPKDHGGSGRTIAATAAAAAAPAAAAPAAAAPAAAAAPHVPAAGANDSLKRLERNVADLEAKVDGAASGLTPEQRQQLLELKVDSLASQFKLLSGRHASAAVSKDVAVKFYYSPYSVTSRAVQLFLEAAGIKYEGTVVDLMTGEHHQEWYKKMNPNSLVPTLVDPAFGDLVVFETPTILRHLAETRGVTAFYPDDARARSRIDSAMDWLNTTFYREFGYHFSYCQLFPHHKLPDEKANAALVEVGRTRALAALKVLNDYWIGNSKFIGGNSPTLADFWGVGLISVGDLLGNDYAKQFPNVHRWRQVIQADFAGYEKVFGPFTAYAKGADKSKLLSIA